jgi:predicted O-methyltransferase YrrM
MNENLSPPTYSFTNNWFESGAKAVWNSLIPQISPTRILEIGSFEGASACYLIEKCSIHSDMELHCIDTFEGGVEQRAGGAAEAKMSDVESRFHFNTQLALGKALNRVTLVVHKGASDVELSKLFVEGRAGYFDFVYIDGSHQASDVLLDALLSFRLLRVNGVIAFDDYLLGPQTPAQINPVNFPKLAVDAFTSIYCKKVRILNAPLYQLYVQKIGD